MQIRYLGCIWGKASVRASWANWVTQHVQRTLGDAIELMIPFMKVTTEYAQLRFEWREQDGDKTLWLIWESDLEDLPTYPARVDANFAAAIVYGRWLIGRN